MNLRTSAWPLGMLALGAALITAPAWADSKQDKKKGQEAKAKTEQAAAVRNWAEVDTNGDGLISPDEMEAYLKARPGPLAQRN